MVFRGFETRNVIKDYIKHILFKLQAEKNE
jgi:hypothetical protein